MQCIHLLVYRASGLRPEYLDYRLGEKNPGKWVFVGDTSPVEVEALAGKSKNGDKPCLIWENL